MAQSVEHILGKDEVIGSIPIISSSKTRRLICAVCGFSFSYNQKLKNNPRLESGIVQFVEKVQQKAGLFLHFVV